MASRWHVPKMDPLADRLDLFCTSREVPFIFMELKLFFLEDVRRFRFRVGFPDGLANPGPTQGVGTKLNWSTSWTATFFERCWSVCLTQRIIVRACCLFDKLCSLSESVEQNLGFSELLSSI